MRENIILLTATEQNIQTMMSWGISLIVGFLTIRVIWDFFQVVNEPETGIKEALQKCGKRIMAAIIAITIESTIWFIREFYK